MSLNVPKLKLLEDVEDRLKDEVVTLDAIKGQLMQLLHTNSLNEREVRFSELIYDESSELLVKTIENFKSNHYIQDYQNQVRRIYKFRVEAATRDTLFEVTESPWIAHAEVVGNILERYSYNKDLLRPFFNKALPKHLRRNVWRALLTYPEAEEEYINLFKEAKWKTLSLNEVEITKKSVELLSEHCHSLAFNEKIVTAMKVVLSYIEKIMERRLPDYMYYILLPIMYTLTDLTASLPRLVGICLKMAEIQTTVWSSNKDTPILNVFFSCIVAIDPKIEEKIKALIDLDYQENKVKLENFIRPFISRLGSGYFNIETTCVVFDQLIMINTLNKMYYLLALTLQLLFPKLIVCEHWDDFLGIFFKDVRRISPLQMESLLEKLPESEDLESRVKVPAELKGQDYLDYVLQAQQFEEEQKINKVHELGQLLSAKRILAEDPVLGMHLQKMMRGNLMEQALNKTKSSRKKRRGTLINANLTRISMGSKDKSKKSGDLSPIGNNSKDSQEIINISGSRDIFIEENSFPHKGNRGSLLAKNSIFQDTSLDQNAPVNKKPINDSSFDQRSFSIAKSPTLGPNSNSVSGITSKKTINNDSKLDPAKKVPDNRDAQSPFSNDIRKGAKGSVSVSQNKSVSGDKSPEPPASNRSRIGEIPEDAIEDIPNLSYLEGGLLGVPDLDNIKPGILDGFDD